MKEAYNTLNGEVEVYSLFENEHETHGTVNVAPRNAERAGELLEEAGYTVYSYEELVENIPGDEYGDEFTRIKFKE